MCIRYMLYWYMKYENFPHAELMFDQELLKYCDSYTQKFASEI